MLPGTAKAATFTVNSTADDVDANPGNGVCATAGGFCTLRAAIQEANTLDGAGRTHEIVFVDAGIPGHRELIDRLSIASRRDLEVVLLDTNSDGIRQMGAILRKRHRIGAVHVFSHGRGGAIELGRARLDSGSIRERSDEVSAWASALAPDADILLYGCDVAANAEGRALVDRVAQLTGANVAASTDPTGTTALGGNWQLEFRRGPVETATLLDGIEQAWWPALLAITVNSNSSAVTPTSDDTLTWSHTVNSGSNRALFVGLSFETGQATGVTYGGTPLTLAGRYTGSTSHTVEIWRLVSPAVGAANIVAVFDAVREVLAGGVAFDGVHPTTPTGAFQGADGTNASPSVTVASAAGEVVLDALFVDVNSLTATANAPQVEQWNRTNGRLGAGSSKAGAASVVMSWTLSGGEEWTLGALAIKPCVGGQSITGRVFEDANFTGTASAFDGGTGDKALPGVDVELYNGGTDAYITSTATDGSGNYTFGCLADGSYKVRVRSATLGSAAASPKGGLNGTVPATWPYPLAEMTWGNGGALYGGQSGNVDDAATGDNAGPGDTHVTVTVSGANVTGVDFGFAYNLIVNTADDANANNLRSKQGSLRQFIKNANAIASAGGTTANSSQFRIPASDPNYNVGTGVYTITPTANLTAIADGATTLDGTTQTVNVGNSNTAVLGAGGTVGVGGLPLSKVAGPEIEIRDTGALTTGIRVQANDATLRGMAIRGFGAAATDGDIVLEAARTGCLIENNVIGSSASSFADPGAASRSYIGVNVDGADSGSIRNNLIGFTQIRAMWLTNTATGWTISGNELRDNGLNSTSGDGIAVNSNSTSATWGNRITGTSSQGYVVTSSANNTFTNNTVSGNGVGLTTGHSESAAITMRPGASATVLDSNVVSANYGAGIQVNNGASGTRLTRNSFFDNGTITARRGDGPTGQIGIDLNAPSDNINLGTHPFHTPNDSGDGDAGGNGLFNFPVLETAMIEGANLTVTGYARPGSKLEFFISDGDTSGFGEGETYLFSATEGGGSDTDLGSGTYGPGPINGISQGADSTNRFAFEVPVPLGVTAGTHLTATAEDGASNTSEFSAVVTVDVSCTIAGRVFEDANYGGGAGRTLAASSGVVRPGARVELYDAGGAFVTATVTDGAGAYLFNGLAPGSYYVRIVVGTVTSSRTGYTPTAAPVQTYRTDASGGAAAPVANQVGGTNPALVDPGNGGPGTVLNTTTYEFTAGLSGTAQSVAPVVVSATAALSGARSRVER